MDWTSDSDDDLEWDTDEEPAAIPTAGTRRGPLPPPTAAAGPSDEAGPSRPSVFTHFISMGFPEDSVEKAIEANGEEDTEAILETLLTFAAVEKNTSDLDEPPVRSFSASDSSDDDEFSDTDDFGKEEFAEEFSERDRKLLTLVEMGFAVDAVSAAISRCGQDASILELADSIDAARMAEENDDIVAVSSMSSSADAESCIIDSHIGKKRRQPEQKIKYNKQISSDWKEEYVTGLCKLPTPMIGFGLPYERPITTERKLPEVAIGRPFFYYENVALTPKGVWETISRFIYDIEPEFVDSKFFCAAARKRGYIHNLPINNRFPCLPIPPKTIHEALPVTKAWWPSWDRRSHLNCLQTCIASAKTTERIRSALAGCDGPPPIKIQDYVLKECKKWNLVWVGPHKVAPLEPDEIEMLLGFPKNHTRGGGISRTERYRSLGNSFQVDTVAYHLSVLKDMFPNGITVLSLFSGIGGAEVALHRLGIHLKVVVSVEISETNRNIVRGWWEQTNQRGTLIDLDDVQQLNSNRLEEMIKTFGGFDLVIGGSPCNNLAGSNRHSRDGLEGKQSSLFFDYFRILESVRGTMGKKV